MHAKAEMRPMWHRGFKGILIDIGHEDNPLNLFTRGQEKDHYKKASQHSPRLCSL